MATASGYAARIGDPISKTVKRKKTRAIQTAIIDPLHTKHDAQTTTRILAMLTFPPLPRRKFSIATRKENILKKINAAAEPRRHRLNLFFKAHYLSIKSVTAKHRRSKPHPSSTTTDRGCELQAFFKNFILARSPRTADVNFQHSL